MYMSMRMCMCMSQTHKCQSTVFWYGFLAGPGGDDHLAHSTHTAARGRTIWWRRISEPLAQPLEELLGLASHPRVDDALLLDIEQRGLGRDNDGPHFFQVS